MICESPNVYKTAWQLEPQSWKEEDEDQNEGRERNNYRVIETLIVFMLPLNQVEYAKKGAD
jgi:hypothetical protein